MYNHKFTLGIIQNAKLSRVQSPWVTCALARLLLARFKEDPRTDLSNKLQLALLGCIGMPITLN